MHLVPSSCLGHFAWEMLFHVWVCAYSLRTTHMACEAFDAVGHHAQNDADMVVAKQL